MFQTLERFLKCCKYPRALENVANVADHLKMLQILEKL